MHVAHGPAQTCMGMGMGKKGGPQNLNELEKNNPYDGCTFSIHKENLFIKEVHVQSESFIPGLLNEHLCLDID